MALAIYILSAFFVFGLIVGSFLNAVLWRMREGMGLGGRSICPLCRAKISWYDNVPLLSFALLGGKCRSCHGKISWRYPAVEFSTGVAFALLGSAFFSWWIVESWIVTAFYLVAIAIFMLIFLYDLETMEIPNILLWIGVGWSLPLLFIMDTFRFNTGISLWSLHLYSGVFAGVIAFLPLFLLAALSREKWMGMGDGFLAFFIGLVVGWPHILFALFCAFASGATVGLFLIALKKKGMESQIPLGPFLIFGAFLAIFLPQWFPGLFDTILFF